jgi:hypothetical protein
VARIGARYAASEAIVFATVRTAGRVSFPLELPSLASRSYACPYNLATTTAGTPVAYSVAKRAAVPELLPAASDPGQGSFGPVGTRDVG